EVRVVARDRYVKHAAAFRRLRRGRLAHLLRLGHRRLRCAASDNHDGCPENEDCSKHGYGVASSRPHPWIGGITPGRTRLFQASVLLLVKTALPYFSSMGTMQCSAMAPPGSSTPSAFGAFSAASTATSIASFSRSSKA